MKIAVAGGTGLVGARVVEEIVSRGHQPVILARARGVDLVHGDGVEGALAGAEAVIDVTDTKQTKRSASIAFFAAVTEHLLSAAQRAGVSHHVALSIVGIDDVDSGYYAGKRRQEHLVQDGPVPATIIRATQFHEFPAQILQRTSFGPLVFMPRIRSQPITVREVAAALVAAALDGPAGRLPDLAGPQVEEMVDLAGRLVRAQHRRKAIVAVRLPGAPGKAMANGALLPRGAGPRGQLSFDDWLASDDAQPWL